MKAQYEAERRYPGSLEGISIKGFFISVISNYAIGYRWCTHSFRFL